MEKRENVGIVPKFVTLNCSPFLSGNMIILSLSSPALGECEEVIVIALAAAPREL